MEMTLNSIRKIMETSVIDLLNMNNWTQEEKDKYVQIITETVENRFLDHVMTDLGDENKLVFKQLLSESNEKAWDFLIEKVPNLEEIAAFETARYKLELSQMKK